MSARRLARLATAAGVVGLALLSSTAPARAEVNGSCDALIKGVSAHDRSSTDPAQAIKVDPDEVVPYSVASSSGVTSRRFLMEYAGVSIVVDKGTSKGNSDFATGAAAVKDYAWLGAGLYKVVGQATLKDGSTCSGAVLVDVGGNPLTTAGGIAGVIAVVTGLIGVVKSSGTRTGELIDELVGFVTGPDAPDPATAGGDGLGGTKAPVTTGGRTGDPASKGAGEGGPSEEEEPGKRKPPRRGGLPVDPSTLAGGAAPGTDPSDGPTQSNGTGGGAGRGAGAAGAGATATTGDGAPEKGDGGGDEASKPPPLPGMGFVTGAGEKADALIEAHETLTGAIEQLPISEEQQEKLTETLGLEKIKEKLDQVKEVTETVTHFEEVGTETVDTLNRWGVPPRMVEAVLWMRWTTEASGRATQKFADAIVTPVIEPVTTALGEAGVEADAEEVAHSILPIQEFAEEASKASMTAVKNVLGGQQRIDQIAQGCLDEEELAIVRPRW